MSILNAYLSPLIKKQVTGRGRASASRTKGPGFESRDERVLTLGFFNIHGASTGLSIQEADIERD